MRHFLYKEGLETSHFPDLEISSFLSGDKNGGNNGANHDERQRSDQAQGHSRSGIEEYQAGTCRQVVEADNTPSTKPTPPVS
jgi:hypothetical protein